MLNSYKDAILVEQSAFFEDEFYYDRIKDADLTPSEWSDIHQYSAAHYFPIIHTLPTVIH